MRIVRYPMMDQTRSKEVREGMGIGFAEKAEAEQVAEQLLCLLQRPKIGTPPGPPPIKGLEPRFISNPVGRKRSDDLAYSCSDPVPYCLEDKWFERHCGVSDQPNGMAKFMTGKGHQKGLVGNHRGHPDEYESVQRRAMRHGKR